MAAGVPKSAQAILNTLVADGLLHIPDTGRLDRAIPAFGASSFGIALATITNAEALLLRATPKILVPAPGVGRVLRFHGCMCYFDRVAAYTESTANLTVKYGTTTGVAASQAMEATGFADATTDAILSGESKIDVLGLIALFDNLPLVLHNIGAGEWGAGNAANVIRVRTIYSIDPTGF